MTWGQQKAFFGVIVVAIAYLQVSAWDEKDLAELREDAERAKANAVRYLIEESGYRNVSASAFHCRAPLKDERLVMQHANPRDPGKGYRCTYWLIAQRQDKGYATVTWSRSPEIVRELPPKRAP
jgi:hypothetical protein